MNAIDPRHARDALHAIDPGCSRDDWHSVGRAAIAAGLSVDDVVEWSRPAANFSSERDVRAAFRSINPNGGTGPGTLWHKAMAAGWRPPQREKPTEGTQGRNGTGKPHQRPASGLRGPSAAEVWARCKPAPADHPYIAAKAGRPEGLRVVPEGDPLRIAGHSVAGWLVVPVLPLGGSPDEPASLQFIPPPGEGRKLNMPGAPMAGAFAVGDIEAGGTVYLCEGIGQAWACWKATGRASLCAFGWGNVARVAAELRQRDAQACIVLCPDAGKESDAERIAAELGASVARMPEGSPPNFDANDFGQREGFDALEVLLAGASAPPQPEPRYRLLSAADLRKLPAQRWRVRGLFPERGVCSIYGPSASGKSFISIDLAAAVGEGAVWFGLRTAQAPVVYLALEGEAGIAMRVRAWETANQRVMPDAARFVLQAFKLTEGADIEALAAVIPQGAVTFIDTTNRAAAGLDENSSADMGRILGAAKALADATAGLVVLVHHSGKDLTKGMRGHSSMFAAMDGAIEVSRDGDRREWRSAKSKDGEDGRAYPFRLAVVELGTDDNGDPATSCVVRAADGAAPEARQVKVPQGGNQRLVYEGLRPLFKDGRTGKAGAPPYRPCIELEAAVMAGAGRLTCATDKRTSRAREAITGLVARGVLGLNEGWLWTA